MKLVSLQAELCKALKQGMVMDCSQMTFRITVPKSRGCEIPFQKKTTEKPTAEQPHEILTFSVA